MFLKLKDGRKLNLFYLSDCFVGKHDKTIVIFYLVNSTKLLEGYATPKEAEDRVKEVNEAMEAARGGGLLQKDTLSDFPKTGNSGTIYIAKDTGQTYYWDKVSKTYIKTGITGRTGVYGYDKKLPTTVGSTITVKKSELNEILKPSVDYSEGSEVIGNNSVHGIITKVDGDNVTISTITDMTIDSFRQVETEKDLPNEGIGNILYYVKDLDDFRIWDETNKKWVKPFHPIIFHDEKITDAKRDTFYVVGDKIKYTTDNVNWIEIDSKHPLSYQDIPVTNADIGTIYVIGDKARYTLDNQNWIYLDSEHPLEFGNTPVATAKLNTIYVDGNKAKYTTDNVNWIELDSDHPLEFANPTIANAKTNVLYVDNGKARYTTDNINWIELNTEHPIIFGDSPVASAKLNTLYVDGNTIKYTTDNANWIEISGGASMKEYLSNVDLVTVPLGVSTINKVDLALTPTDKLELEQLVYDNKGTVGRIIKIDTTTKDIEVETITIAGSGSGAPGMPIAPDTKELKIKNGGNGYAVGDIVESTTTGIFAEVTSVDSNGIILDVTDTTATAQSTLGTGAVIDYEQIIYGGYGTNWAALSDAAVLVAQALADKFEYETGYDFDITNAGTGYSIGDVIATDVTDINVIVTNVDSNGEIQSVEYTRNSINTTTGTGATIAAQPNSNIFIIPKEYWNNGTALFSLVNDEGAQVEFYRTGDVLVKYNAAADSKIYKFTFDEVNGIITQEFYKIKGGGSGDAFLTEDITSNVLVGAAPANTLFKKDTTFTEFAKKILLKEIAPTITFNATNSGLKEVGTSVSGSTLTTNITSLGTGTITSIEFYEGSNLLDTQSYVTGTNSYSFNYTNTITTNTTFKTIVYYTKADGTNSTINQTKSITFVYASYYGTVSTLTPVEADIKLLNKSIKNTKAFTWNNISVTDERFCYAYPKSFGTLTSIKDANNFEYIGSYTMSTIQIDSIDYYLYVLTDPTTGSGFKQIYS